MHLEKVWIRDVVMEMLNKPIYLSNWLFYSTPTLKLPHNFFQSC